MHLFETAMGIRVPDVTASDMRRVDEVAVASFGIDLLQMMENAGRALADSVLELREGGSVTVVAGAGGNGGGGMAAARHLHGRAVEVRVVASRPEERWSDATARQARILRASGVPIDGPEMAEAAVAEAEVAVDALIGYGLRAPVEGTDAQLIRTLNRFARRIVSLDLPSGLDATDGAIGGPIVRPRRTLTLALPKTGLADPTADVAETLLADLGIPPEVFAQAGIPNYRTPFRGESRVPLRCTGTWASRCRDAAGEAAWR